MPPESHDHRLDRAEAALAHLERNFDALNSVVIDQGKLIARLQRQLETLGETMRAQDGDRIAPHNQKPPHYAP
jgi:uncharacterized coiled-coil protein SlyX